jgi:GT2 family glycosyltransferase
VVDNHSPDGSAEVIRERVAPKSGITIPRVTFFSNPTNEGFAAGNNIGINHALLEDVDYVYLLNNDAKFHPEAITEAVKRAESDPTIGSVQSFMLLWQKPDVVNSTGGMVHFLGFGFVRDNGRLARDVTIPDGTEINYASGAAALYRASVLKKVGLLDPFLFLYHEDLELGWRLRLAGFKNVFSKTSIVYHHYEFKRSVAKFFWMERNRILVHASHLRVASLLLLVPWMAIVELALIAFAVNGGWINEKGKVYLALLRPSAWMYVCRKRRESAGLRRVSDHEIMRLWTAKIEHQETSNPFVEKFGNPILSCVLALLKRMIVW